LEAFLAVEFLVLPLRRLSFFLFPLCSPPGQKHFFGGFRPFGSLARNPNVCHYYGHPRFLFLPSFFERSPRLLSFSIPGSPSNRGLLVLFSGNLAKFPHRRVMWLSSLGSVKTPFPPSRIHLAGRYHFGLCSFVRWIDRRRTEPFLKASRRPSPLPRAVCSRYRLF